MAVFSERASRRGGENTQNYNRYAYVLNNPLLYTDPSGEEFISIGIAIAIGAFIAGATYTITALTTGMQFTWGGLAGQMFIGAASAAVTFGIGSGAESMFTKVAMGFWQGAYQGAVIGSITGAVGVVVNAGFNGSLDNLTLNAVLGGAAIGALTGAIMGGIKAGKVKANFKKGTEALGVTDSESAKIPVNDSTLSKAQKVWYPDAPMDNVENFTVENIPSEYKSALISGSGTNQAITVAEVSDGLTNGCSSVYFDKSAFSTLKNLYYTMGHEFVHVSQNALLSGLTIAQFNMASNNIYKEYFGYKFETNLGSKADGGYFFEYDWDYKSMNMELYNKFNYTNFSWTQNTNFTKKF